mmetsp:Transcript_126114/g.368553  ORF Transcript_126114/g.368553 Transcript_126114/m.368553 type:complete len:291 (+) Transcript_126114:1094-1966(+)
MPPQQRLRQRGLVAGPAAGARGLDEAVRHEVVGEDHELLDEVVRGAGGRLLLEAHDAAVGVRAEGELAPLQHHRTATDAQLPTGGRELGERLEVPPHGSRDGGLADVLSLERPVHLVVVQACLRADHRPGEGGRLGRHKPALAVQGEENGEGQAVAVWKQRAEVLAQPPRQHGVDLADEVDGGRPAPRLRVHQAARPHEVGDVRDVHAHTEGALLGTWLDRDRIVEVLGLGRVHGDAAQAPQVRPARRQRLGGHRGRVGEEAAEALLRLVLEWPPLKAVECQECIGLSRH